MDLPEIPATLCQIRGFILFDLIVAGFSFFFLTSNTTTLFSLLVLDSAQLGRSKRNTNF
jgi:hypothetical protein